MDDILYILGIVLIFCLITYLAYITTRYIAGKTGAASKGKHIRIIETTILGKDKQLLLIKAGGEYLLLSSSGKDIGLIKEIKLEEYDENIVFNRQNPLSFSSFLKNNIDKMKNAINKTKGSDKYNKEKQDE